MTSGYLQRRLGKLCEDLKVQYNGTVTDVGGNIYMLAYGENFFDPRYLIKVKKELQICDIFSIVNKLNMKFEMK